MKKIFSILLIFCSIFLIGWTKTTSDFSENFTTQPSDSRVFTQGIFIKNNQIFLSSGAPNYLSGTHSSVGILDKNGIFEPKFSLDPEIFFGEWITQLNGKIYFLTWKKQKWFILNAQNFEKIGEFDYKNQEWWGLASDGEKIFMSDGTNQITFFDENFEKIGAISVSENNQKITKINELEYFDNAILANIWLTNDIIKIDPNSGKVLTRWNFDFLKNREIKENLQAQEMNGIAFDKAKNQIILTGKMWKNLYIFDADFFKK